MKAVNSPWHDPLAPELCCSPGPCTPKAFCSPQAPEPQRFPRRRPLGSHLAARGYLSQALIFSVDLSWLVPYPQVFFWGQAKNPRLVKPSARFSYKKSRFALELDHFSPPPVRVGWGHSGRLWGTHGAWCQWSGQVGWHGPSLGRIQAVPVSAGTLEAAPSCQPRCPSVLGPVTRMRHQRWHGKGSSFLPALNCNKGNLFYPSSHASVPLLRSV